MNVLTDQDVFTPTIAFLRSYGHDVVTAAERQLSRSDDRVVLRVAMAERRIVITRDRDFGNLVFANNFGIGVIFLRATKTNLSLIHLELNRVLTQYTQNELLGSFVVVEPGRHRVRKPIDQSLNP